MTAEDYSYLAFEKQQEASIRSALTIAEVGQRMARAYEQGGFPDDEDMLKLLRSLDQIYPIKEVEKYADEIERLMNLNKRTKQDVIDNYQCDNAKMARYEDD